MAYGVKANLCEIESSRENGVFFIADGISWATFKIKEEDPNQKKKRSKKYKDKFGIEKDYELTNVLSTLGYKLLEKSISINFQDSPLPPQVLGKKLFSGVFSNVDRIENVISVEEVYNYLFSLL